MIPLIARAKAHGDQTAIISPEGTFTYRHLVEASSRVSSGLLEGRKDLSEERVAFLTPRGFVYPAVQWGIWRAGGIAVPLCEIHPPSELNYVIRDSNTDIVVAHPQFVAQLLPMAEELGIRFLLTDYLMESPIGQLPEIDSAKRAMILYTSGTTGRPKGVVSTHFNIQAQVISLIKAWEWTSNDYILHVLPLHHVHGIINISNVTLPSLWQYLLYM